MSMRQPLLARGPARFAFVSLALSLGGLAGCKQATAPFQPSIFTNPGEVTLACFDTSAAADADPTLPLDCCDKVIGTGDALVAKLDRCGRDSTPIAHALVTQVQRGEVAAVDLEAKKVLDSDKKIPGYTFVDVGGLPTAIAIPRSLETEPDEAPQGPLWTYVASRENNSVRAVPTCRFLVGRGCGPEQESDLYPNAAAFARGTERALAGEPLDMLLAADGKGLWITLPDAGLLAYVRLPTGANRYEPFPAEIVYYPLPGGFDLKPPVAELETEPYRFACEPGAKADDPKPWQAETLQMPLSVPAESTRTPRPTLLRVVDLSATELAGDAPGQLLFVADEGQMALHAYAQDAEGAVSLVASLPVGAPLRDFAVTPEVPALGPSYDQLIDGEYYGSEIATKRYLYAIDERDGSLMAFSLSFAGGVPALQPLRAPVPARDSVHRTANHADRFSLGADGFTARALDVVNTGARLRSDGESFDDAFCSDGNKARDKRLSELDRDTDAKKSAWDKTVNDGLSLEEQRAAQQAYVMAAEDLAVLTNVAPTSLRGVFVMVATTRGQLVALDVHDYDLECRAKLQCAVAPDDTLGVALQRHAPRLTGPEVPTVTVSPASELTLNPECPAGYVLDDDKHVCISRNVWVAPGATIAVGYEAAIVAPVANGVLEGASRGRITLKGPQGVDLCARGANADDGLLVGILTPPEDSLNRGAKCSVSSFSTVPLLRVIEARRDELLLEPLPDVPRDTLLDCYREFVTFDLRLDDQYLVNPNSIGYQHTNMSAADGTCVRDESLDSRFTSRAKLNEPFVNQFVAFTLTSEEELETGDDAPDAGAEADGGMEEEPPPEPDAGDDEDASAEGDAGSEPDAGAEEESSDDEKEKTLKREVNPGIATVNLVSPIAVSIAGNNSRSDTLPHRVRYFPQGDFLFVVDQASQGLRRFFLTPTFEADPDSNFR